ncbi:hypothetical protein GCM10008949_23820 [Deinococcus humi]|nr:hypothetical protein GCM10008949_23820 [Deinococcus humi]
MAQELAGVLRKASCAKIIGSYPRAGYGGLNPKQEGGPSGRPVLKSRIQVRVASVRATPQPK